MLRAGLVVQFVIIPDWQNLYFTGLKSLFGRVTVGKFGSRWVVIEFSPAYGSCLKPIWSCDIDRIYDASSMCPPRGMFNK